MLGHEFTVQEPAELVEAVRELGARMSRAVAATPAPAPHEAGRTGDTPDGTRPSGPA
jgi:hypothetical protein